MDSTDPNSPDYVSQVGGLGAHPKKVAEEGKSPYFKEI